MLLVPSVFRNRSGTTTSPAGFLSNVLFMPEWRDTVASVLFCCKCCVISLPVPPWIFDYRSSVDCWVLTGYNFCHSAIRSPCMMTNVRLDCVYIMVLQGSGFALDIGLVTKRSEQNQLFWSPKSEDQCH